MTAEAATSFCVPVWINWIIGVSFLFFLGYLVWDFYKRYYEIIGKIRPDLQGVSLYLSPMLRPFLIYSKAARSEPGYFKVWRPALILLLSILPIAFVVFLAADHSCAA